MVNLLLYANTLYFHMFMGNLYSNVLQTPFILSSQSFTPFLISHPPPLLLSSTTTLFHSSTNTSQSIPRGSKVNLEKIVFIQCYTEIKCAWENSDDKKRVLRVSLYPPHTSLTLLLSTWENK